jgi:hypothetical protein
MVRELGVDVDDYLSWQKENVSVLSDSTMRYVERITGEYDDIMNSSARYFRYNLTSKSEGMAEGLRRYARYNTEELLSNLGRETGEYFWNNADVSDIVREMHMFAERNVDATELLLRDVEKCFALNARHAGELAKSVDRFFRWRTEQWVMLKTELNRYISHNVENYRTFAEAPLRYIRRQEEEFRKLKELVPHYFLYNMNKTEGLNAALKRFVDSQIGNSSRY